MKRIVVDANLCAGCRLCELACSFFHEEVFSPTLSRVTVVKQDVYGLDFPVLCRQCDHCPAIDACPTNALTRTELGTIAADIEACVGCTQCVEECTYNAVKLVSEPLICDLCEGDPQCVRRCPTKALSYEESKPDTRRPEYVFLEMRRRWGIDG